MRAIGGAAAAAAQGESVGAGAARVGEATEVTESALRARDAYIQGFLNLRLNKILAAQHFLEAAQLGHSDAQHHLGAMHANGIINAENKANESDIDFGQAVHWFKKSAKQGNPEAQRGLGVLFFCGRLEGRQARPDLVDMHKALYWMEKAAMQGDACAQADTAVIYLGTSPDLRDSNKAMYWSMRAAKGGNARGQYLVALFYQGGYPGEKLTIMHEKKAMKYFRLCFDKANEVDINDASQTKIREYLTSLIRKTLDEADLALFCHHQEMINDATYLDKRVEEVLTQDEVILLIGILVNTESKILGWKKVMSYLTTLILKHSDCFEAIDLAKIPPAEKELFAKDLVEYPALRLRILSSLAKDTRADIDVQLHASFDRTDAVRERAFHGLLGDVPLADFCKAKANFRLYQAEFNAYQTTFERCLVKVGAAIAEERGDVTKLKELASHLRTKIAEYKATHDRLEEAVV